MTVTEKAYAKINLFLDVIGRRKDGFHEIVSVMQSVSLCDTISLSAIHSEERKIFISSNEPTLENDENNLIYKSALKYMSYFDINAGIEVNLEKRVPIGAGLGGGSSDAAATLRAMNKIFRLASKEQLLEMAAELGSDVAFCVDGGCALCTGRGEKLRPFKYDISPYFVIAIGKGRVSTPSAYKMLDEKYGDFTKYNAEKNLPNINNLPIYNIFEQVIDLKEICEIKNIMTENFADMTLMSGSGPSVFGVFLDSSSALAAKEALEERGYLAFDCVKV